MGEESNKWLPHLQGSVPKKVYGYPVGMYTIALEGWRRGLNLKFENNNRGTSVIKYTLSHNSRTHSFTAALGDLVTIKAKKICKDKRLTKEYLAKANVSIPEGKAFDEKSTNNEIIKYANKLEYPLVIKPISGFGGKGVIANIKSEESFISSLNYVRNDLNYKKIIVEKHVTGDDYRVYVVDNQVIGAINRIPANIAGNGSSTIDELIEKKNQERRNNPALKGSPIKKDKELLTLIKNYGYSLGSIPIEGEVIYLKTKSNISAGGSPIDATDKITEKVKNNAIEALKAIPGLVQGGVDILWDPDKDKVTVIELNTVPSIRTHLYPAKGDARDIPKAIIDYYFPDTEQNLKQPLYYFDISNILEGFKNNTLQVASVPNYPIGELADFHFKIKNVEKMVSFKRHIHKLAKSLYLNGFVEDAGSKSLKILVSGQQVSLEKFKKAFASDIYSGEIEELEWDSPINIGFEIINSNTRKKTCSISLQEFKRMEKERDFYRRKYEEVNTSKLWRIIKMFKKIKN